jgi:dihydroflavonol-4-reductase
MPVATATGIRITKRSMHFYPSDTFAELDLSPRPREESARDAVLWYREQHWIQLNGPEPGKDVMPGQE